MATSLLDIEVGAPVIVQERLSHARVPRRGQVVRIATAYLWVRVEGIRDNLRVARVSGRGTLHSNSYEVRIADQETLDKIDRQDAIDRFRAALFLADKALRGISAERLLQSASVEELRTLDRLLRELADKAEEKEATPRRAFPPSAFR